MNALHVFDARRQAWRPLPCGVSLVILSLLLLAPQPVPSAWASMRLAEQAAVGPAVPPEAAARAVRQDIHAVPELAKWRENMTAFGKKYCEILRDRAKPWAVRSENAYYDGERIYYQIAEYTGDDSWLLCAAAAEVTYRDEYLLAQPKPGAVAGWMIFPHGLLLDYLKTKDEKSKEALLALAQNAAFAYAPLEWTKDIGSSREVAYNIEAKYLARVYGYGDEARIKALVEQAFGHMDAWFKTGTAAYVRPFMVALTAEALIIHYDQTRDSRVLPTLKLAADVMWRKMWLPDKQSFMYTDRDGAPGGGKDPAPDVNLLISPVYAWVCMMTKDRDYCDKHDQIFAGGVRAAWLGDGKQYDQQYRWSFQGLKWREQ